MMGVGWDGGLRMRRIGKVLMIMRGLGLMGMIMLRGGWVVGVSVMRMVMLMMGVMGVQEEDENDDAV
jgi:hypothetical protein